MGNYGRRILMALGTALVWGGTGPVAKLITVSGLSQVSVVCYRASLEGEVFFCLGKIYPSGCGWG